MRATRHERLRALRPGPAASGALAGGRGLRHLLHQRAARRGACAACNQERRLIAPPGPGAIMCADCAGLPLTHLCALCSVEDKLFEKGRCPRCSLRGRASDLLARPGAEPIAGLTGLIEAITAARNPYSALNWLRTGAAAVILAEVATGRTALTHQALDLHPSQRAADYLRHLLAASGALPARDEALARAERWSREVLDAIDEPADRRLVQAYLTFRTAVGAHPPPAR